MTTPNPRRRIRAFAPTDWYELYQSTENKRREALSELPDTPDIGIIALGEMTWGIMTGEKIIAVVMGESGALAIKDIINELADRLKIQKVITNLHAGKG